MRGSKTTFLPALLVSGLLAFAACDGSDDGGTDALPDVQWPDGGDDPGGSDPGAPDVRDDPGVDALPDDAIEDAAPDLGPEDPGPTDEGQDPGVEDSGPPPPTFCHSNEDCVDEEVCVLSLGECQPRATWLDDSPSLVGIHPKEVAAGDVLVIDGRRFYSGISSYMPTSRIGTVNVTGMMSDENRLLVPVQAGMSGDVNVWSYYNGLQRLVWSEPVAQAPTGVVPCTTQTPAASWEPGIRPDLSGPYAAGYVDLGDATWTRVYYPAECGSVRRPPIASDEAFPLVCILHGNGAVHLQYEYLAELLATWGFVSFMPQTEQNMAGDPYQSMLDGLMPVITKMRGRALDDVHPVLAGVTTTADIAFIGHSRGTGRAEEAIGSDADLKAHAVGFVFLGPVDDDKKVPGQFIVFGGKKDMQSLPLTYNGTYDNQDAPRYKVELPGGNHGSFCDHKVYGYSELGIIGDQQPTIPRTLQLLIVQRFTLPLLQRAFGLDEPFADVLDNAAGTSDFTITRDP